LWQKNSIWHFKAEYLTSKNQRIEIKLEINLKSSSFICGRYFNEGVDIPG
jgi:hypothetical protein